MATQPTLCDGCELDYFYIIGKYHGGVFPGPERPQVEEEESDQEEDN